MANELTTTNTSNSAALDTRAATVLTDDDAAALSELLTRHGMNANTRRAYTSALAQFNGWLAAKGYAPDAPGVCAYLQALDSAGAKTSTIKTHLAAIRFMHDVAKGREVSAAMKAITNKRADALTNPNIRGVRGNNSNGKRQLDLDTLRAMCAAAPDDLTGMRNRALILVGFWVAARRSELVALNVSDVSFVKGGAEVLITRSKTDQQGAGLYKPLVSLANGDATVCPVTALRAWLAASGITSGPLFPALNHGKLTTPRRPITAQVVALVVKDYCTRAGLDAAAFAGHSLRSGFVSAARKLNIPDATIQKVTGHKTNAMLNRYDRRDVRDALTVIRRAVLDAPASDDADE